MNLPAQSREPRFIVIRQGPVTWEWRYREHLHYRRTSIPRTVPPKDALDIVIHDWLTLHIDEVVTGAWELTQDEIEAGKKGIPESEVPPTGRPFGVS